MHGSGIGGENYNAQDPIHVHTHILHTRDLKTIPINGAK